jgi:DNA-binding XRE family transcriptional regulator
MASSKGGLRHGRSKAKRRQTRAAKSERERDPLQIEFGARLREARERAGLSVEAAARLARAPRSTYYSWESGARRPRRLAALASAFSTSVAELYGGAA